MLIAQYDQHDAYLTKEAYNELDEDQKEYTEPGEYSEDIDTIYYEDIDTMYYEYYEYDVKEAFKKRKFPLILAAINSNWQRQTGYAKCDNVNEVLSKVASFDSGSIELHRGTGSKLWFRLSGTHDCPCGFSIEVRTK